MHQMQVCILNTIAMRSDGEGSLNIIYKRDGNQLPYTLLRSGRQKSIAMRVEFGGFRSALRPVSPGLQAIEDDTTRLSTALRHFLCEPGICESIMLNGKIKIR